MALVADDDAELKVKAKAKAEVYYGDEACQLCAQLLLREAGLPNGLLPLEDLTECGYVQETGYVWLKQGRRVDHVFRSLGRLVSYGAEITGYAEKGRIRKVKGIKTRELMLWVPVEEIAALGDPAAGGKLVCKSVAGITRTFPASAFHVPEKAAAAEEVKVDCARAPPATPVLVLMDRSGAPPVVKNN